ncbi:DUF881 domain-containing protein [Hathewaya histolytica]|uniref:Division initiation protein n=1 Tax=Hathewaya histolytica TaxID=1498 RepID=A0A4U9R8N2_HATHI|nr:DUF881 domain-containing protein [Hathewaya histolytica]VTQ87914.1 division initiation protein [Hathewaya histolytica]
MKNVSSKIAMASVFAILGFLITYQLRVSYDESKKLDINNQNAEILKENEMLEKQKKDYESKTASLQKKIDEYEKAAAGRNEYSKMMLEQLDNLKKVNGLVDLDGEGIIVYITPKASLFSNGNTVQPISDLDLLKVVNELYAAEAEAISINDIRLNSRSGIRTASNAIKINNDKISFNKQVVIKAIGNKKLLESALSFPGNIPELLERNCDIKWELNDKILIQKDSTQNMEFKYAKPIKKE